ncbi:MAG: hypothetical protein V2I38_09055 [Alcanivoracaceae bacterium]|nr:hypothetical protein [Alcanivoracaceae bacterium]
MNNKKHTVSIVAFTCLALSCLLTATIANAQIAGHNVILVHGLVVEDLIKAPTKEELLSRRKVSDFWQARAEGYLNWSAADRLEGGIAEIVFEQAKRHSAEGLCSNGCVLVTHSTGDLVSRYFLAHQEAWLSSAGYAPLNIVATIDFAGAGGGTDLADIAVAAANSDYVPLPMKLAAGAVLGMDLDVTDYRELGVVLDLTTSGARNHANWPNTIPRLRFSVNGGEGVYVATKPFIRGADDTVVPAHSSCGASAPDAIQSCSSNIAYEGKRSWQFGPRGLLPNHFPILMADNYDHFTLVADQHKGNTTYVLNNFSAGLNVDFQTNTHTVTRRWWEVWKNAGTWQYVAGSDSTSFSRLIYQALND